MINVCVYFFMGVFELNFSECQIVNELMRNTFCKYKAICYEHYNKFKNKENECQHHFQNV